MLALSVSCAHTTLVCIFSFHEMLHTLTSACVSVRVHKHGKKQWENEIYKSHIQVMKHT